MSGIAGGSCEAPDTSSVGLKILTCSATDRASNTTVAEVEYQVAEFPFAGFFSPVDNQPVFNVVKAGSAVPVKFSLAGDRGFDIFQTGFPGSGATSCDVTQPLDGIEEIVRDSQSGLHYDVATGQYIYVWKTDKAWAGRCRVLTLALSDGTVHQANFKFTKN